MAASGRAPFKGRASGLKAPEQRPSGARRCAPVFFDFFFFCLALFVWAALCCTTHGHSVLMSPWVQTTTCTRSAPILLPPRPPASAKFPTCLFLASPRHPENKVLRIEECWTRTLRSSCPHSSSPLQPWPPRFVHGRYIWRPISEECSVTCKSSWQAERRQI